MHSVSRFFKGSASALRTRAPRTAAIQTSVVSQWVPLAIVVFDLCICAAAVIAGGDRPNIHFEEAALVTWLNGVQLLACGVLSLGIYLLARAEGRRSPDSGFWLMVFGLGLFFTFDELFELHEVAGRGIERFGVVLSWLYRASDLILMIYGGVVLALVWAYRRELVRDRRAFSYFTRGAAIIALSLAMDFWTYLLALSKWYRWETAIEESLKLVGFGFVLGGLVVRFERERAARRARVTVAKSEVG